LDQLGQVIDLRGGNTGWPNPFWPACLQPAKNNEGYQVSWTFWLSHLGASRQV